MNYHGMWLDILEEFSLLQSRRHRNRDYYKKIAMVIAEGHTIRQAIKRWHHQNRTRLYEKKNADRAKKRLERHLALAKQPHTEVVCTYCGTVNRVPEGKKWPGRGWCCDEQMVVQGSQSKRLRGRVPRRKNGSKVAA